MTYDSVTTVTGPYTTHSGAFGTSVQIPTSAANPGVAPDTIQFQVYSDETFTTDGVADVSINVINHHQYPFNHTVATHTLSLPSNPTVYVTVNSPNRVPADFTFQVYATFLWTV